jgi:hypothetical protein
LLQFARNTTDGTIYAISGDGHILAIKGVFRAGQIGELVSTEVDQLPVALAW